MVELSYGGSMVGANQLPKGAKFKLLATDFLQIDALFSKRIKVGFLSPAARILLFITLSGSASVKDAKRVSGLSQRAFFQAYARLKKNGLVRVEPVPFRVMVAAKCSCLVMRFTPCLMEGEGA